MFTMELPIRPPPEYTLLRVQIVDLNPISMDSPLVFNEISKTQMACGTCLSVLDCEMWGIWAWRVSHLDIWAREQDSFW